MTHDKHLVEYTQATRKNMFVYFFCVFVIILLAVLLYTPEVKTPIVITDFKDSKEEFLNYNPRFKKITDFDYFYYSQDMQLKFVIDLTKDMYWKHVNELYTINSNIREFDIYTTNRLKFIEAIFITTSNYVYAFDKLNPIKIHMAYEFKNKLNGYLFDIDKLPVSVDRHGIINIESRDNKDSIIKWNSGIDSSKIALVCTFDSIKTYTIEGDNEKQTMAEGKIDGELLLKLSEYSVLLTQNTFKLFENKKLLYEDELIDKFSYKKIEIYTYYENSKKYLEIDIDDLVYKVVLNAEKDHYLRFGFGTPKGKHIFVENLIIEPVLTEDIKEKLYENKAF